MTISGAPDLLATLVAATRRVVQVRERRRPVTEFLAEPPQRPAGLAFVEALRSPAFPCIIAECKRRSPSKGILRSDYDPVRHARSYEAAGAAAISVLTEPTFFDGAPEHLRAVRASVSVPLLRKDFIISEYQVHESAWLGADAVLLIAGAVAAALEPLLATARARGLAALVEVHDDRELERALEAGASVVGVNSRDLRTLGIDQEVLERLAPLIPQHVVRVAESGIRSHDDLRRLSAVGYDAFLVGERLIAAPDPGDGLRELRRA